jgi:hypothetical protein
MMSTNARYHILPDRHEGSVMVFDTETGAIQHPACWQDLSALYHYLVDRGRLDESQKLLAESMSGSKPITSLLARMSQEAANGNSRP